MVIENFLDGFIAAANAFDVNAFLAHWHSDAILNDPSVGRQFCGHIQIQAYFEDYFIGYQTQTELVNTEVSGEHKAHIKVLFKGNFPQREIEGVFDFTFKHGKIITATADLI